MKREKNTPPSSADYQLTEMLVVRVPAQLTRQLEELAEHQTRLEGRKTSGPILARRILMEMVPARLARLKAGEPPAEDEGYVLPILQPKSISADTEPCTLSLLDPKR